MNLRGSKTCENLMRSFAGESQARNRYDYAAEVAKQEGYFIIQDLFHYTANQEMAHGKVFLDHLKQFNGENLNISAGYPIDDSSSTLKLLQNSEKNELEEGDTIYTDFAKIATDEGFKEVAESFTKISTIEKVHSERFGRYARELSQGSLFKKDEVVQWMCTHCGFVYEGTEAPSTCPVCQYPQGYYMLFSTTNFE